MPIDLPPTRKSLGRKVVVFLASPPAAGSGIPTRTEVNAGLQSALHLYVPFNVEPNQNTGEGPRKLGSDRPPTEKGLVTWPAVEIQGSRIPQLAGAPGGEGNELYDLMKAAYANGDKITTVTFDDLPGDTSTIAANDVGDIYLTEPTIIRKGETGDGEYDQFSFKTSLIIVGGDPIAEDHIFV